MIFLNFFTWVLKGVSNNYYCIVLSGEANVYTLGDIGGHRIVSTKLPMAGSSGNSLIATGSTTTRLLGTFQVNVR